MEYKNVSSEKRKKNQESEHMVYMCPWDGLDDVMSGVGKEKTFWNMNIFWMRKKGKIVKSRIDMR